MKKNTPKSKSGSTLIWALIVVLVLCLVLAAGLTIAQKQQNTAVTRHTENQAYYTAMSIDKAVIDWLDNTEYSFPSDMKEYTGTDPKAKFIIWILARPAGAWNEFTVTALSGSAAAALPKDMGSVRIYAMRESDDSILIKATAEYSGEENSIAGGLKNTTTVTEDDPPADGSGDDIAPPGDSDDDPPDDEDDTPPEPPKVTITCTWTSSGAYREA